MEYARYKREIDMPKGYLIIASSGLYENLEGEAHERHVVFEFDSFAEAKRFYESPAYEAAKALRAGVATGTFVILEGTS
ncbi:DUF1330 domain-containing protein [Burkholderia sp. Ac-20353]|uniref:DUF1330 domain-containing protein n=1 Tax=Burkholderia sp. Ac-20353 TaxID=2703894 RepID=UPI00321802C8